MTISNKVIRLTQREKMITSIEQTENITIIFRLTTHIKNKLVMCGRCKEYMNHFDVSINEHTEFECSYCGKNVKIPLCIWNEDEYIFPNEYYSDSKKAVIKAQSLAQAYRKLNDLQSQANSFKCVQCGAMYSEESNASEGLTCDNCQGD